MRLVEQFVDYLRACYAPEHVSLVRMDVPPTALDACLDEARAAVVVSSRPVDQALARHGLCPSFVGCSPDGEYVAIVEQEPMRHVTPASRSFRVAAIMPVFNEADVIQGTLRYLIDDGIGVYVIDNWSTDGTPDIVRQFDGRGLLGVERFPARQASSAYDLRRILARVEELAGRLDADWLILHDADERRRSPWPAVGLRDALYQVDRAGFTCIDHVTLNFWPTDNGYDSTQDLEAYFPYFEFSDHPGHFHQRRGWKNLGRVSLAPSAGHDVEFEGRRVYPFKFLLKHYPIRSEAHGRRKVLHERQARWNPEERALGWHQQYECVASFVRAPGELERFDPRTFYARHLIERLSGVGIFASPPAWATPPMWKARPFGSHDHPL